MFERFRRKGKELSELDKAVVHGLTMGEGQRSLTEHEEAQALGINRLMLRDEGLEKWLDKQIVIGKTEDGGTVVDLNALACRIKATHLIRTSFMDESDARIAMLETRRFFNRIEMEMEEDVYEFGGTNVAEALADVINTSWSDSIRGRKALLLKVVERHLQVTVPEKRQPPEKGKLL